jgi:hypothetical protein
MACPKIIRCGVWKALSPKERFALKTGVGIGKFILKGCPLDDAPTGENTENESIS